MKNLLQKYIALLLLALFLFPMAEKELHSYSHLQDVHCGSSNKHFHSLEHNCSICDFTIKSTNAAATVDYKFIPVVSPFCFHPFIESVNTPSAFKDLPARAPPIV